MSKENFESFVSELLKGAANIESVNFHFGDCNSTTYMGDVEEEYEEEYSAEPCGCCDDCGCDGCGCDEPGCPGDIPVIDGDAVAEWVEKETGLDHATIDKVICAEIEYLKRNGVVTQVDDGCEADTGHGEVETNGQGQKTGPEQTHKSKKEAKDDELDALFESLLPGILGMGLMGALLCDILGSAKKKEDKDGHKE